MGGGNGREASRKVVHWTSHPLRPIVRISCYSKVFATSPSLYWACNWVLGACLLMWAPFAWATVRVVPMLKLPQRPATWIFLSSIFLEGVLLMWHTSSPQIEHTRAAMANPQFNTDRPIFGLPRTGLS